MTVVAEPAVVGRVLGAPLSRLEGREKVTGQAKYAYEHDVDGVAHAVIVGSAVAKGEVRSVDAADALAAEGVLAVLWHGNAPRLGDTGNAEHAIFQSPAVAYRGQPVAAVVADSLEAARGAERLVRVTIEPAEHDVLLRPDHPGLYAPDHVNPSFETDAEQGDFDGAFAAARVRVDLTYETPAVHNNPMEPHATLAYWEGGRVTLYDSTQGVGRVREAVARAFGVDEADVRVVSTHVGGGFGSKGAARPQAILAAMAARVTGRPVKVAASRHQMFALTGYRTPTIQRLRLGADADGRLVALAHEVVEQSSTLVEFAEQAAVVSRMMYAAPNRRTRHRLVRLDVPTPSWMRAPGECPGMYALESAMDELAVACGVDPIELRVRNEPDVDPETGQPFSTRNLVACLREGAEEFGWEVRDPTPRLVQDGPWLVGTGVASSTYPARRRPSQARVRAEQDGTYLVQIAASDIGTGARTVLAQIAAGELDAPVERVRVEVGDTELPPAMLAGGSMGTTSWGSAIVEACRTLRSRIGAGGTPAEPLEVVADTEAAVAADEPLARYAFGAQFAEARVNVETGEIRVPRLHGVFAVGRVINAKTARSQLIGGMTMGLGMALHEESVLDVRFGDYVNHDLAGYHVPAHADVLDVDARWIDEVDPQVSPMGAKGLGEIGIVGTAAAIGNALYHATGVRFRRLPITPARVIEAL